MLLKITTEEYNKIIGWVTFGLSNMSNIFQLTRVADCIQLRVHYQKTTVPSLPYTATKEHAIGFQPSRVLVFNGGMDPWNKTNVSVFNTLGMRLQEDLVVLKPPSSLLNPV